MGRAYGPALVCVSSQPLTDKPDLIQQPFYSPQTCAQTPGRSEDFLRTHKTREICVVCPVFSGLCCNRSVDWGACVSIGCGADRQTSSPSLRQYYMANWEAVILFPRTV